MHPKISAFFLFGSFLFTILDRDRPNDEECKDRPGLCIK